MMMTEYEQRTLKILEKRFRDLDHLCLQQINELWKKYQQKEGKKNPLIMGKIVGIKWVLALIKELERRDDKIF